MPVYRYRGINAKGDMITGYVCGANASEIRKKVAGYAIDLVSLYRQWGLHIKKKNIELFFIYLGYYLKAGYRLSPALSLVQDSFSGTFKDIVSSLQGRLVEGLLLSEACKEYPMIFSPAMIALMSAGEHSGQFIHACHQCALHVSEFHQKKEKILKAISYPLLSLLFFLCSFVILVQELLPNILSLFADVGQPLSWTTCFLQATTKVFSWKAGIVISAIAVLGGMCRKWLFFKLTGKWVSKHIYAQFFSTISLLMNENISLIEALKIACDCMTHVSLTPYFDQMIQEIREGKTLSQSLEILPHFPTSYIHFIQSGDHSGHQAQAITAVSHMMSQSMNRFYERLTFWISPTLLVFVAVCFWVLIEGTFIPLYSSINGFTYGD